MRVVLQFSGHFLLLGLRTAAPHGSTPSLARSSGGGLVDAVRIADDPEAWNPGRESCHVVCPAYRAEKWPCTPIHGVHKYPDLSGFMARENRTGGSGLAHSGQLSMHL